MRCEFIIAGAGVGTSVAVLPVYEDGTRGCLVELAANDQLYPEDILAALDAVCSGATDSDSTDSNYRAFHFGYPHLLPKCNGGQLPSLLRKARARLQSACSSTAEGIGGDSTVVVTSVDLNGVTEMNEKGHCKILTKKALREVGSQWCKTSCHRPR